MRARGNCGDFVTFSCIGHFIYSEASFIRDSLIWRSFTGDIKCSENADAFIYSGVNHINILIKHSPA